MKKVRVESDSIGSMKVPYDAYYGVQSLRAKLNFSITGKRLHPDFIKNMALIKKACALVNKNGGHLSVEKADAICKACDEVMMGKFDDDFIVDTIQGGAGTSSNMNANEVIANRAGELLGGELGAYDKVHPNDDVNMAQSTNDVIPTAGKLTTLDLLKPLVDELNRLDEALMKKAYEFDDIIKMGRTQLQDAVPMRLGQSFSGYASMIKRAIVRIEDSYKELYVLNLGATAIGTSINVPKDYLESIVPTLGTLSNYPLKQAEDLFDATENLDAFVTASGAVKAAAVCLSKMSNDLRLLSSGPKTGLAEINLPAMQNGSSIMPGKVNPVIPEVVSQIAFEVIGNDVAITMAAEAGQLELNAFEPVVFTKLFNSITHLTNAVTTLIDNCIVGITANRERCKDLVEHSAGITTALCPYIGYKKAAEIAKKALHSKHTVRELVMETGLLPEDEVEKILRPYEMTGAGSATIKH